MKTEGSAVLILAAGSSSRMGKTKQLLPWGNTTLLKNAIDNVKASLCDKIIVVLGANSEIIEKIIPPDVISVINDDWQDGMGSSISCGINYLSKLKKKIDTVIITLGDQPLIDAEHYNSMLSLFRIDDKAIIATDYNGRAGVPALFSGKYFKQLGELNAEFGAKEFLARNKGDIHLLEAKGKTADIDTKADYIKLNKSNK